MRKRLVNGASCLAACLLAACNPAHEAQPAQAREQVLNLYSWAEYFPSPVLRQFEAETGIKVNFSVFDSNDVAETTLSAGDSGFDLVTVNAVPHLGRQIPKGLWRPLDRSKLHNLGNVDGKLLQMLARRRSRQPVCDPLHVGNHGAHIQRRQDPLDHARRTG